MSSTAILIKKYKSLDDKVAAIFYETNSQKIRTDPQQLHSAFYKISKKHADFFSGLHFKSGGRFPYSESLDQTFPALAISGLLSCQNPEYDVYTINLTQRELIKKNVLPLFNSRKEKKEIKEIAKELNELLET